MVHARQPLSAADESLLIGRALDGDRSAYDDLAVDALPRLRASVARMLGHPDETEEVVQLALLKGWQKLGGFRGGARFSTWLCSIGVRQALDHLRAAKRWRAQAQQLLADSCRDDEARSTALVGSLHAADARFDAHEHVAFCLVCVGRSLPPEAHAAVVCRDVLGLSNAEGAAATGLAQGAFRHRLSEGRSLMVERFEGLCALVNKQGPCWQCAGLRHVAPEDRRGPEPPDLAAAGDTPLEQLEARVAIARAADLAGPTHGLHDLMFRWLEQLEAADWGDAQAAGSCGPPDD